MLLADVVHAQSLAGIAPKQFRGLRPFVANASPPKTLARFVKLPTARFVDAHGFLNELR